MHIKWLQTEKVQGKGFVQITITSITILKGLVTKSCEAAEVVRRELF